MLVEFHAWVGLVAIAHLVDDLQHGIVQYRCINDYQSGKVIIGFIHLTYAMVRENHANGLFLGVVRLIIVQQLYMAFMSNTDDVIRRHKRFVACWQSSDIIKDDYAFILNLLEIV